MRSIRAYPAELLEPSLSLVDLLDPVLCFAEAVLERILEWRQPWVELDNTWLWSIGVGLRLGTENPPVPSGGPSTGLLMIELTLSSLTASMIAITCVCRVQ